MFFILFFILSILFNTSAFPAEIEVLIVDNGKIQKEDDRSKVLHDQIDKLEKEYGITISSKILDRYIYDVTSSNPSKPYNGFNLRANYDNPLIVKSFHVPAYALLDSDSKEKTREEYQYLMNESLKIKDPSIKEMPPTEDNYFPYAALEINSVYMTKEKILKDVGYYNLKTKIMTTPGFESLLHESLHIWHSNHPREVSELLHSKGSYYEKVKQSESICKKYLNASEAPIINAHTCGANNDKEVIKSILLNIKWPSRCAPGFDRICPISVDNIDSSYCKKNTFFLYEGKILCEPNEENEGLSWDLHSMDNEAEYFAILMQLYVFSPDDFNRIATEKEKIFANDLYIRFYNFKIIREATDYLSGKLNSREIFYMNSCSKN